MRSCAAISPIIMRVAGAGERDQGAESIFCFLRNHFGEIGSPKPYLIDRVNSRFAPAKQSSDGSRDVNPLRGRPLTRAARVLKNGDLAQASQGSLPKKLHIKTFGCQMNAYDSERMAEALGRQGYEPDRGSRRKADLVILNTCHIREKAAEKVYSELGRARAQQGARQREGRDTLIAVAGCVAQAEGAEIMAPAPHRRYRGRAAKLSPPRGSGRRGRQPPARGRSPPIFRPRTNSRICPSAPSAKAADFGLRHRAGRLRQVLHLLRGALYARRRILAARVGASSPRWSGWPASGAREITLLGQNVNAYHGAGPDGQRLDARQAAAAARRKCRAIERLRYTTSHPLDMDDELIALFGDEPKLMPYLHLPFQSGSDRILKAMNRRHTRRRI